MDPHLEDILAAECDRQGMRLSPEAFRQMLTEAIGRLDTHQMIRLPQGSISVPDFVRSFNSDHLKGEAEKEPQKPEQNLTASYRRQIAETRSRVLPADWEQVRNRMVGKTREFMDEVAAARKGAVR